MTTERTRLVRALGTAKPASIAELALAAGIGEPAVKQHLSELQADGLRFEVAASPGYQLTLAVDPMEEVDLKSALTAAGFPFVDQVVLLDTVDSTSNWLSHQVDSSELHGQVCISEFQSAGRGRRGRSWQGSPYRHLMLSIGWRFRREVAKLGGLSLSIGLALAGRLRELGADKVGLKWPNDLFASGEKLGGVLVELNSSADKEVCAIIGVGLNIDDPALATLDTGQAVTDLASQIKGLLPQRTELIASVLVDLARTLEQFDYRGFTPDQTGWNALDIFRGKAIRAASQRDIVVGVGEGADELGRYRLRCDDGAITPIIAGDISLSFDSPGSALS
jgi:BirA family biotin operon repressor/biotin-[acetyl-CoA-carboxylase] ligase